MGSSHNGQGYLTLTREEGDGVYLFVKSPLTLHPGDYVEFIQGEIFKWRDSVKHRETKKSKQVIYAPSGIEIVRKELIEDLGGLDRVIERVRNGETLLKRRKNNGST